MEGRGRKTNLHECDKLILKSNDRSIIKSIVEDFISELNVQLNLSKNSSQTVMLDQTAAGRVSRIDAIQQQKMAASSLMRDKKRFVQLEIVLAKLISDEGKENSDFGYCQECDELIALERLKVKPESKYCVQCQSLLDSV